MDNKMTKSLSEQIKVLIDLQKIDVQIYQIKLDLQAFPEQKEELEKQFKKSQEEFAQIEQNLKTIQMKQKELENEVLAKEQAIDKYKSQQAQVKTNQEYSALTSEIQNATADKSLKEDEALKFMDEVDRQKKVVQEAKAKLAEDQKKHQEDLRALDQKKADIEKDIQGYEAERKGYIPSVDQELLQRYELLIQKRGGVAMAKLEGENCGGCSLAFPPQVVNLVKLKEEMVFCESCSRIVYDEEG